MPNKSKNTLTIKEILAEIEKRKNHSFGDWQIGQYRIGWKDSLENLKLWILERANSDF